MLNTFRSKLMVATIGMVAASTASAATTQTLQAQNLGAQPVNTLATRLNLGQDMTLVARSTAALANGNKVVRQQQLYRGVPVYGRSIAVVQDAQGNALRGSGELMQAGSGDFISVAPRLTPVAAVTVLKTHAHTVLLGDATMQNQQAELFVYPQDAGQTLLVYRVSYFVSDAKNPTRPTAIINANTGKVIQSWDGLTDASANGPGGNTKTGKYLYGTDYAALNVTKSGSTCSLKNPDVSTYNLYQQTSGTGTLVSFICPTSNTDAINGAFSPANDAHHFGSVVHDMYYGYTGGGPLTFPLVMKVHYGKDYENAFWDGSVMSFGDGADTFYPLVSLDVTGHEISHGYTEQHSGLQYNFQSGGMNEAFSDMAGEASEYFDRGANDFLVGGEIIKDGDALRYMCNPTQDGGSIDNAKNYTPIMDVHYSSGVYNKSFCLLARTKGWDTRKAFQAYALANKVYWTANSTFNSGACGVESAATDLNFSKADVVAAFKGVGVTCSSGTSLPSGAASMPLPLR